MSLEAQGVGVVLGGSTILADVCLEAARGETVAVLGPSGSGKSTLLRVVAGLQRPDTGRVVVTGRDVTELPPHRRGVGLLFQDDALFPHLTVEANVAFGLRMERRPVAEIRERVDRLLRLVGLESMGSRRMQGLSGGERKRVALARALAPEPEVILLDEPLGGLDRPLQERLLDELRGLFDELALTVVLVTHDVSEAFALADRVALLRAGRIVQTATPDGLWRAPADDWVARFLGLGNVERTAAGARVVRPEAVRLAPAAGGEARVVEIGRAGPLVRLLVRYDDGRELWSATTDLSHAAVGDRVRVSVDPLGVIEVPASRDA